MKLGFIGTGVMGSAVARHLLEAGHEVAVYNRTKAKADPLVTEGAIWADTPKAVAEQSNILFTRCVKQMILLRIVVNHTTQLNYLSLR